jgi:putative ABC transport system permease protein
MSIIWRKVWRDLWDNKLRTFLVVLSTAVGVFAWGLVFGLSDVMRTRMTESHRASLFPHIIFYTGAFDQDVVEAIQRESGVADAESEDGTFLRWKFEGEKDWRDGYVLARDDYEAQRMNLLGLLDGRWPSGRKLAVERLSSQYFGVPMGTTILVEFGRNERHLPVEGIVRHSQVFPPQFGGDAVFFGDAETVAWLAGRPEGYNRLNVRLESFTEEGANETADRIEDRLERMGVGVGFFEVVDPEVHWFQEQMDAVLLILTVLGVLSLGLSGFLIINMMNATVAQQVWQIGVMKTVGATGGRVVRVFLVMASIYGLLSTLLAVPLGAVAAHLLAGWLLDLFNIVVGDFRVMPNAAVIQVAVGLVVPLLAALMPVVGGARITVHRAIGNYGLGAGFGSNWLDRLIGRVRRLPRPLALSLRNTFRRKARIALTLITLVLGGVMFIVVISVGASMNNTLEVLLDDLGFDVAVGFERPYRVTRLVEVAEQVPGVARAEVWSYRSAELSLADGEEREVFLRGTPPDSEMFSPRLVDGRGLLPEDGRAILLNSRIAADEGFQVGDAITLTVEGREAAWTVVGLVINVNNDQRENFVPFEALARETGTVGRGGTVWVMGEEDDSAAQERLIRDLRDAYATAHIEAAGFDSTDEIRQMNRSQFDIITYLMLTMAVLAAVVGGIGLASTMSINVVERRREIGVMRAVGATSAAIAGIFVVEGVLVGVLSWLLAAPLSYPGARVFSDLIGNTLFQLPLDFDYAVDGVIGWLAIVALLSALASLWPALRATKVSVREALAYE